MNPTWSEALREAYALAGRQQTIVDTLEIAAQGLDSLYICKGYAPFVGVLDAYASRPNEPVTFLPVPFDLTLPKNDATGAPTLTITVDNVDRAVSNLIQQVLDAGNLVVIIYRPYLASDQNAPAVTRPLTLFMTGAQINLTTVQIQAAYPDVVNQKFPNDYYTAARFPGLNR